MWRGRHSSKLDMFCFLKIYRKLVCLKPFILNFKDLMGINIEICWFREREPYAGILHK